MNHQPNTPASINEAVALGTKIADWTGGAYTAYRTDTGESEPWLKVSVERLGYAVLALIEPSATPASNVWPQYLAGIIETYIKQNRTNEDREAGIAKIIERRLYCLAAPGAAIDARQPVPYHSQPCKCEVCAASREALSPATVAQPVAPAESRKNAKADAEYEVGEWMGENDVVLKIPAYRNLIALVLAAQSAAQPCASQGCGGAVEEAVANVVSCWNRFRWAKETSDAVSALAALSTEKSGGAA